MCRKIHIKKHLIPEVYSVLLLHARAYGTFVCGKERVEKGKVREKEKVRARKRDRERKTERVVEMPA